MVSIRTRRKTVLCGKFAPVVVTNMIFAPKNTSLIDDLQLEKVFESTFTPDYILLVQNK